MGNLWESVLGVFRDSLEALHGLLEGVFGLAAWGWAIILLTVIVRILLLPLAIKQTRSMRAMQKLQPKIKGLQKKYKVDRDLMRKDPEKYRQRKQKLNEEMMALYKEEGVNPASGCLPLVLQAPIFFALFRVLNDFEPLKTAEFYFLTRYVEGLGGTVSAAGWPGWLLIALMAGTMFWSQRQMLARNQSEGAQAQQQKIMMYVMPVFLAGISLNFPLGVLLYWVTTNLWQMGQQAVILREVKHELEAGGGDDAGKPAGRKPSGDPSGNGSAKSRPSTPAKERGTRPSPKKSSHTPRRGDRRAGNK